MPFQPSGCSKEAAEKFAIEQELQGLKPVMFWIVYGPTKVVP
jgi:hypothetical protein